MRLFTKSLTHPVPERFPLFEEILKTQGSRLLVRSRNPGSATAAKVGRDPDAADRRLFGRQSGWTRPTPTMTPEAESIRQRRRQAAKVGRP